MSTIHLLFVKSKHIKNIYMSQNYSNYKLITMYVHKNITNYFSLVKSSYLMYLRLCLSDNQIRTCTNIKLCSYEQSLQNQIKRTYGHMLLNLSLNVHFYSAIQSAYQHLQVSKKYYTTSQEKQYHPSSIISKSTCT